MPSSGKFLFTPPLPPRSVSKAASTTNDKNDIGTNHLLLSGDDVQLTNKQIRGMAIDISVYCQAADDSHNNTALRYGRYECSINLNKALQTDGFALVRGFGVSARLCNDALRAARSFLHEADESVRRSCLTKDRARRGYSPMCTENFASLIGEQGPNDLVKKFRVGPKSNNTNDEHHLHPISSLHQPNEWPTEADWDQNNAHFFKSTIEKYFETICKVADCILRAICDGILAENENACIAESIRILSESSNNTNNDAGHDNETKNHTSILTLLGYQPGSRHKKGHRAYMRPLISAHTDVGVITVLHFDGGQCAALERAAKSRTCDNTISSENIEWIDVNLPTLDDDDNDPVFVVNVGDCLSELSGGTLRSTLHRVMPRPSCTQPIEHDKAHHAIASTTRTCLALFVGLEPSATLKFPGSEEVLSYEEWRRQRILRATAVRKYKTTQSSNIPSGI